MSIRPDVARRMQTALAVLALVRARHSASRVELMAEFGPCTAHNRNLRHLFDVLDRMKRDQQLACTGGTQTRRWVLHPSQLAHAPLVAPRNYDMMRAPLYQPEPWRCARSSAMDFAGLPSLGLRC